MAGSIITRGMRQASNRAAKTVTSFQCWDQESERGTRPKWHIGAQKLIFCVNPNCNTTILLRFCFYAQVCDKAFKLSVFKLILKNISHIKHFTLVSAYSFFFPSSYYSFHLLLYKIVNTKSTKILLLKTPQTTTSPFFGNPTL